MKGKVLVFGSINTDLVTYVDVLPTPGETITGGKFMSFSGGKGTNQAVAAARAGAEVKMFGYLGDDSLGRERMTSLGNASVSIRNITVPENPQGETIVSLFQNEIPQIVTEAIIPECKKRKMLVLWNIAPACQEKPSKETLEAVDFLICNRSELMTLVGEGDNETLAHVLRSWGPPNVVDTVGTGDCFCRVFACSLSFNISVRESLRRASAAAALSATIRGTQTSMPSADDIDRFLSATRKEDDK